MSEHTPGPWEARNSAGAGWSVRKQHEHPGYTGLAPICSMAWWQFDIPGIIDDKISGANARLIAAGPDLLEACRAAIGALSGSIFAMTNQRYLKPRIGMEAEHAAAVKSKAELEAAIAKAEGAGQ